MSHTTNLFRRVEDCIDARKQPREASSCEAYSAKSCLSRSFESAIAVPILTKECTLCSLRELFPTTRPHVLCGETSSF